MIIEIENTSSPGASFTSNTNLVMLKIYEWICEHKGMSLPFREFRMKLQNEKEINDNNNRNIYPLLKNGGLVNYEKGADLQVDYFYTNTGLAYVKTLETVRMLDNEGFTKKQISEATKKFGAIQQEIIFGALKKIVNQSDVNYVEPFQDLIKFLLKFGKVNKVEFAYLLYVKQMEGIQETLNTMAPQIQMYRCGDLEIKVHVKVRNDIDLREKTKTDKREEGLSFLTSYGYFTSLLLQAGLTKKFDKYYEVVEEKRGLLEQLGGVLNG